MKIRYLNFWLFVVVLIAGSLIFSLRVGLARGVLAGFDLGACVFIVGTLRLMYGEKADGMRTPPKENDPDHYILLIVALLIVAVVLVAVTVEMTGSGGGFAIAVALACCTLLIAWVFSNLLFALHYTRSFYSPSERGDDESRSDGSKSDTGGLQFLGDETPLYSDFAYFSFVLGMTFQVSDVDITSRAVRRLDLYHALVAFLFNIIVVALSVSLIGGMLQK